MLLVKWLNFISFKSLFRERKKRSHLRTQYRNLVRYELNDPDSPALISNLVDISESGLQLSMKRKIRIGTLLNMVINLVEKNQDVPVVAKVVWTRPIPGYRGGYRVGVAFQEINPDHQETLREIVTSPKIKKRRRAA